MSSPYLSTCFPCPSRVQSQQTSPSAITFGNRPSKPSSYLCRGIGLFFLRPTGSGVFGGRQVRLVMRTRTNMPLGKDHKKSLDEKTSSCDFFLFFDTTTKLACRPWVTDHTYFGGQHASCFNLIKLCSSCNFILRSAHLLCNPSPCLSCSKAFINPSSASVFFIKKNKTNKIPAPSFSSLGI